MWISGGRGYFRQTSRGTSRRPLVASWSEPPSRAGGGKGNRWEVGERAEPGAGRSEFLEEGCFGENELGLQGLEGRKRP